MSLWELYYYFSERKGELIWRGAELLPEGESGFGVKSDRGEVRVLLQIGGSFLKAVYRRPGVPESITNLIGSKEIIFWSVLGSLDYLRSLQLSLEEEFFSRQGALAQ